MGICSTVDLLQKSDDPFLLDIPRWLRWELRLASARVVLRAIALVVLIVILIDVSVQLRRSPFDSVPKLLISRDLHQGANLCRALHRIPLAPSQDPVVMGRPVSLSAGGRLHGGLYLKASLGYGSGATMTPSLAHDSGEWYSAVIAAIGHGQALHIVAAARVSAGGTSTNETELLALVYTSDALLHPWSAAASDVFVQRFGILRLQLGAQVRTSQILPIPLASVQQAAETFDALQEDIDSDRGSCRVDMFGGSSNSSSPRIGASVVAYCEDPQGGIEMDVEWFGGMALVGIALEDAQYADNGTVVTALVSMWAERTMHCISASECVCSGF